VNEGKMNERFEAIEKRLDVLEKLLKKPEIVQAVLTNGIFEENEGGIIVTQIIGDGPKEKAKNIVLLSLLGYKQKLGEIKVLASKLRENVALHQIPLENFATWVNELSPQSIIKEGKKGSTKTIYKLTTFGEAKAKNLLKSVLENEKSDGIN
jgi:F0F1-type ATP synthase delta subunit